MENNLNKSLAALDAAADELLKKSNSDDADKDIKPDDVSDDDKSKDDDIEKCDKPDGDNLKKSDDDDSSDDADEDEGEDTEKSLEDIQQDIVEDFKQDSDIANGVATSEFQAAMVAALAKALGDIQYDMNNNIKSDNHATSILAKSLQAVIASNQQLRTDNDRLTRRLNKLEKSLNQGFEGVMEAIDNLSTQPAHIRKSVGSINIHDKDFSKSVAGSGNSVESLTKSQVMSILTNELYANNPEVRAADIISYESGAPLRPELQSLVASKCK